MNGALPFLEGVRKLAVARFQIPGGENEPDLLLFAGIDSQADHIPIGTVRSLCSTPWLEKCDREAQELETFYKQDVMAACQRLAERFTHVA